MFIGMEEVCFAQMTTAHGGAGVEVAVGCCSSVVLVLFSPGTVRDLSGLTMVCCFVCCCCCCFILFGLFGVFVFCFFVQRLL